MKRMLDRMLMVGAVVIALSTSTAKAVHFEIDDWSTGFDPNPITCNVAGCSSETNSQFGINPSGKVDRKATLYQKNDGTGPVPGTSVGALAETRSSGATVNTDNGNYLVFQTGEGVYGSLDLLYGFDARFIPVVFLNVANLTDKDFNVAVFTLNEAGDEFDFQVSYLVEARHVHEEELYFPKAVSTDELLIIYNPLAAMGSSWSFRANGLVNWEWDGFDEDKKASDIHVELCCIAIPEPSTWALLMAGFFGFGIATKVTRQRQSHLT